MLTRLTVYGRLAGKGSRTAGVRKNGTRYSRPASKYEKAWVAAVADAAQWRVAEGGDLPVAPYSVELAFYFDPPKRAKHPYPSSIDVDKLVRSTLDGLVQGGLLVDDRHVVEIRARKEFAAAAGGECCTIAVTGATRETSGFSPIAAAAA